MIVVPSAHPYCDLSAASMSQKDVPLDVLAKTVKIVGLGNPLLDIVAHVDDDFLAR